MYKVNRIVVSKYINKKFSDRDREILRYTRMGISERRKTQYILLIFYLGVVGTCASLVLNNYKNSEPNDNLMLIFLFPILLIVPIHTLFWYHTLKVEQLDAERRSIIPDLKNWQSIMGIVSVNVTLLLPLIALPFLSGFLLHKENECLFKNFHFLSVFHGSVIVFLVAIFVEIDGHIQRRKIISNESNKKSSNQV